MKQLFHTSCRAGENNNLSGGVGGQQTRAISEGVSPNLRREWENQAGFPLPQDYRSGDYIAETAPVRLTLMDLPNVGRVLVHSRFIGPDPETLRDGNYFTHFIGDVPADLDARKALESWGSSEWVREDSEQHGTCLPDIDILPSHGELTVESWIRQREAHPEWSPLLKVTIAALCDPAEGRLFLAAPSEAVAWALWGAVRILPPLMIAKLTFSTYEQGVFSSYARVVGTWWPRPEENDLPTSCYAGSHFAFNLASGRLSTRAEKPLAPQSYEAWTLALLEAGAFAKLDDLTAAAESLKIADTDRLTLFFHLTQGSEVETRYIDEALKNQALAALLLRTKTGVVAVARHMVDSDVPLEAPGVIEFRDTLSRDPALAADAARAHVQRMTEQPGENAFRPSFTHLLEPVIKAVWLTDLRRWCTSDNQPPEVELLVMAMQLTQGREPEMQPERAKWLRYAGPHVGSLLTAGTINLEEAVTAMMPALLAEPMPAETAVLLGTQPHLLGRVLKHMVRQPECSHAAGRVAVTGLSAAADAGKTRGCLEELSEDPDSMDAALPAVLDAAPRLLLRWIIDLPHNRIGKWIDRRSEYLTKIAEALLQWSELPAVWSNPRTQEILEAASQVAANDAHISLCWLAAVNEPIEFNQDSADRIYKALQQAPSSILDMLLRSLANRVAQRMATLQDYDEDRYFKVGRWVLVCSGHNPRHDTQSPPIRRSQPPPLPSPSQLPSEIATIPQNQEVNDLGGSTAVETKISVPQRLQRHIQKGFSGLKGLLRRAKGPSDAPQVPQPCGEHVEGILFSPARLMNLVLLAAEMERLSHEKWSFLIASGVVVLSGRDSDHAESHRLTKELADRASWLAMHDMVFLEIAEEKFARYPGSLAHRIWRKISA